MKRLITLLLAAGIVFGATAGQASAVELSAGGNWQFGLSWWDRSFDKHDGQDNFYAAQRIRPEFRFKADEKLSATLQLEIGTGHWGNGAFGMGGDATNAIKFRYGYVDWVVPGVEAKVRMGLQYAQNATYTFANVLDVDVAGVSVNYDFNDNVGLSLAWYRPYNSSINRTHDAVDVFYAAVPVNGDGFGVTPWGMYSTIGKNALSLLLGGDIDNGDLYGLYGLLPAVIPGVSLTDRGKAWWLGIGGELTLFDPFTVAADFIYGHADLGSVPAGDLKRSGWLVALQASYKLDWATPGLIAWYGSGDDSDAADGSERLPSIFAESWGTNFGMDGGWFDAASLTLGLSGTWGVGLRLDDISFIENLTHSLRATYYQGTNNKAMAGGVGTFVDNASNIYLTTRDRAWEFNFENSYQIYKNLTASFELGYIKLDLDGKVWSTSDLDEKLYKAAVYMTYKF